MNHRPTTLVEKSRQILRRKDYALGTERRYLDWIRRYILFHKKRHLASMGKEEIEDFLTHLSVPGNVAASTQNQALKADR